MLVLDGSNDDDDDSVLQQIGSLDDNDSINDTVSTSYVILHFDNITEEAEEGITAEDIGYILEDITSLLGQ